MVTTISITIIIVHIILSLLLALLHCCYHSCHYHYYYNQYHCKSFNNIIQTIVNTIMMVIIIRKCFNSWTVFLWFPLHVLVPVIIFALDVSALVLISSGLIWMSQPRVHLLRFVLNVSAPVLVNYVFFECLSTLAHFLLLVLECLSSYAHVLWFSLNVLAPGPASYGFLWMS